MLALALCGVHVPAQQRQIGKRADYCVTCARDARGKILRSAAQRRAFMRQSGYPNGRPGYRIDHTVPLACGGADTPENMKWLTLAEKAAKDRVERRGCTR